MRTTKHLRAYILPCLALIALLGVFSIAYADDTGLKVHLIAPFSSNGENVTTVNSFTSYFTKAIPVILGFAAVLAVVQIVVGGIQYAISGMNPGQMSDARDRMTQALIGLALALGSYILLNTLDSRLVDLNLGLQNLDGSGTTGAAPGAQQVVRRGCKTYQDGSKGCDLFLQDAGGPDSCAECPGPTAIFLLGANGTRGACIYENNTCSDRVMPADECPDRSGGRNSWFVFCQEEVIAKCGSKAYTRPCRATSTTP